ncbi:MAG: Nif3-like dinuclear metal center hexameric protein [Gemmatimonadaceae bacterium]
MPTFDDIAHDLDTLLRIGEIADYPNALNGVQVHTDREITRVAAAVDARERTIRAAVDAEAQLLIVHHGLFWGGVRPLRGPHLRRVRALLDGDLALYSAHLPLDAHPGIGNNVLLARTLGLEPTGAFAHARGTDIGVTGSATLPMAALIERARTFAAGYGGGVRVSHDPGDRMTGRWGVCTGAGASSENLAESAELGLNTLITGEGPHHTAIEAEELDIIVIYAGHYATETLGVQALARHVSETFGVPWCFLDAPTTL